MSGLWYGLAWLDRRAERRAKELIAAIEAVEDTHSSLVNHISPLYGKIAPIEKLEAAVRGQSVSLALIPAAMTGLTTKIEGIFERYEEHALAPDADVAAPLVMSRIERHRKSLEDASEASLVALAESIKKGGHEPRLRVRGDE